MSFWFMMIQVQVFSWLPMKIDVSGIAVGQVMVR